MPSRLSLILTATGVVSPAFTDTSERASHRVGHDVSPLKGQARPAGGERAPAWVTVFQHVIVPDAGHCPGPTRPSSRDYFCPGSRSLDGSKPGGSSTPGGSLAPRLPSAPPFLGAGCSAEAVLPSAALRGSPLTRRPFLAFFDALALPLPPGMPGMPMPPAIRFIIFWASKKRVTRLLTALTLVPEPAA